MAIRRGGALVLVMSAIAVTGATAVLGFANPDRYRPAVIAYLLRTQPESR